LDALQESGKISCHLDVGRDEEAKKYHRRVQKLAKELEESGAHTEEAVKEKDGQIGELFTKVFKVAEYPPIPKPSDDELRLTYSQKTLSMKLANP
jgi:hypothetical protein